MLGREAMLFFHHEKSREKKEGSVNISYCITIVSFDGIPYELLWQLYQLVAVYSISAHLKSYLLGDRLSERGFEPGDVSQP